MCKDSLITSIRTVCDLKDLTDDDRIEAILEAIDKALGIWIQVKWSCYQNDAAKSFVLSKHLLTRNLFESHTEFNPTILRWPGIVGRCSCRGCRGDSRGVGRDIQVWSRKWRSFFSNYLVQDSLFERVDRGSLTSLSRLVGEHLFGEIDELCSAPRVKIKCRYLRICDLLRDRHIKGITPSFIGEMQCAALELFNNAQIQRLQRIETLDHIENVIKNGDRTLQSAHWNDEHRICFTNSVLDLFETIDSIITELLSLPLYQYQIVHVEQLFASLIAHCVIALDPKSFVSDSVFVLFIGDLYKLRERATAYLEHHDFTALKDGASRSKRNVTSMKHDYHHGLPVYSPSWTFYMARGLDMRQQRTSTLHT